MRRVVLDANAVISHGQAFAGRTRAASGDGMVLVLPRSVKRELVDDVLERDSAPRNHRESAETIRGLIDDGVLDVQSPDFETYGNVVDEARRRIADESLPEHAVKADQYVPALACELAADGEVCLVTADRKLAGVVRDLADRHGVGDRVAVREPLTVL